MIRVRHTSVLVLVSLVALLGGCAVESEEPTSEPSNDQLVEVADEQVSADEEVEAAAETGDAEGDLVELHRGELDLDTAKLWNRGGPYPIPWQDAHRASVLPPNPSGPDDR